MLSQGADGIGIREELLEIQNLLKRRSDDKMAVNVASCARKCIQGSDRFSNLDLHDEFYRNYEKSPKH